MIRSPARPKQPIGPTEPGKPTIPVRTPKRIPAAILGPVILALAVAGTYTGIKAAYGGFSHPYHLYVTVPRAGQELAVGSDVRMRGVVVGSVSDVRLVDRQVRLTLQIDRRYHVPAGAQAVVSLKTLLGSKYVDLQFPSYTAPFLADGGQVKVGQVGPELEDVLADCVPVLQAIRPQDLATVVVTLASAAQGEGQNISRAIQANQQLSSLFARTLPAQEKELYDFDVIFGALKSKGVDLNQLADAVNQGVPVYASAQAQKYLQQALDALTPFANNLADLLTFNRADWDRMISSGDVVLGAIAARPEQLASLVQGLYRYVYRLGGHPFPVGDDSGAAGFTAFIGGDSSKKNIDQICGAIPPPVRPLIPLCQGFGR